MESITNWLAEDEEAAWETLYKHCLRDSCALKAIHWLQHYSDKIVLMHNAEFHSKNLIDKKKKKKHK